MNKPKAVIISDVHYSLNTYKVADAAMRIALEKAEELQVPLIVAGDLHDTKALMRGECVKAMIKTFKLAKVKCYVLVGNHDLLNEKGKEHSLEFLRPYVDIIDAPTYLTFLDIYAIPYLSDKNELLAYLKTIPKGATVVCHQGVAGADMGHYIKDTSSVPLEVFKYFRVISGHYHKHQTLYYHEYVNDDATGTFTYVGNPYTLSFAEAGDHKGFAILYDLGLPLRVLTFLRRHLIVSWSVDQVLGNSKGDFPFFTTDQDLLWIKITGAKSELKNIKKKDIEKIVGYSNFKLDLIPNDQKQQLSTTEKDYTSAQLLDALVDTLDEKDKEKQYLKILWREIL